MINEKESIPELNNENVSKTKVLEKSLGVIDGTIKVKNKIPELWDGKAAERIVKVLVDGFK